MADYEIKLNEDALQGLLGGSEGLKVLLTDVLNQVLEEQVKDHLNAAPYERTEDRKGYRNGNRVRKLKTRVGTLELNIPQVRDGEFSTELFSRYQRSEQAFILSLMEMVIQGVSTRKVTKITEELCGVSFSKSTVSRLCGRLDPMVHAFRNRKLSETDYPFLLVDAMVIKLREGDRVRPYSFLIAIAVNGEGLREVVGFQVGNSESESSWSSLFENLKNRGLKGLNLVVSDSHSGLVKAVKKQFQGVSWQRCQVHFMRNIISSSPKSILPELTPLLRSMFNAHSVKTARQIKDEIVEKFENKAQKAMNCLEEGFDDAMAVMGLPCRYKKRLKSTNSVERLNEEIRRRERVIRIFPNEQSAIRLIGALLMEQHEQWVTGKKYLDMKEYHEYRKTEKKDKIKSLHMV